MNKWVISCKKCKYGIRFLRLSCMVLCVTDFPQQHYIRTSRRGNRGWLLSPYLYLHKEVKLPTYSQCGNLRILMSLNILREITIVKLVTSYVNWVVIMPISKCFDKFMLWKFTAFKTVKVAVFKTLEICPNLISRKIWDWGSKILEIPYCDTYSRALEPTRQN